MANSTVHARTVFHNTPKYKYTYGISLFHTSTPERRVVTHTVKTTRPAGMGPQNDESRLKAFRAMAGVDYCTVIKARDLAQL